MLLRSVCCAADLLLVYHRDCIPALLGTAAALYFSRFQAQQRYCCRCNSSSCVTPDGMCVAADMSDVWHLTCDICVTYIMTYV
jgi:hypothetical protein